MNKVKAFAIVGLAYGIIFSSSAVASLAVATEDGENAKGSSRDVLIVNSYEKASLEGVKADIAALQSIGNVTTELTALGMAAVFGELSKRQCQNDDLPIIVWYSGKMSKIGETYVFVGIDNQPWPVVAVLESLARSNCRFLVGLDGAGVSSALPIPDNIALFSVAKEGEYAHQSSAGSPFTRAFSALTRDSSKPNGWKPDDLAKTTNDMVNTLYISDRHLNRIPAVKFQLRFGAKPWSSVMIRRAEFTSR